MTISPKLPQFLISLPFFVLGGWCLIAPASVERLFLTPQFQHNSATSAVLIGCFGAQAMISGLFAAFSQFRSITFIVYAIALLPFFAFNYYFVFVLPVFNYGLVVDFGANALMLLICLWGYRITENAS